MSEFISVCPKCRQQILCDTAYTGQRIACPICLQEITMPEPSQPPPQFSTSLSPATPTVPPGAAPGKRNSLILAAVICAVLLIGGVGATLFALHKNSTDTAPAPSPTTAAAPVPAPAVTTPPAPVEAPAPKPTTPPTVSPDQCRALWTCNQDSGTNVNDASGNGNNATLVGDDVAWVKSSKTGSTALSLGGSSYAETSGPVIDTTKSFTVAAWVAISGIDRRYNQTMVSIDGNQISGFFLMLQPEKSGPRFYFTRRSDDRSSSDRALASAAHPAALNTWYHLAGVYDAEAKTLSLYMNGELQSTGPCEKAWRASGKTAIGRGFFEGRNKDFFNGVICDIRMYDSALTAAQIQTLATQ